MMSGGPDLLDDSPDVTTFIAHASWQAKAKDLTSSRLL